ncbi:MAG: nitrilase-related carbon-nitrogen hydrolase [Caldilineaceae bacterium]
MLASLLDVAAVDLWQHYIDFFGQLAYTYRITVVAPSGYLPDPRDGVVRNLTGVFGSDGHLCGTQAKVILHEQDRFWAQAGVNWEVIQTELGLLGVMIGNDALYPEVGRLFALKGAEILVVQGACTTIALYEKLRTGALARMQDNQLFAAASFVVGDYHLDSQQQFPFVGKSVIIAPQELTPRHNGVLAEMSNPYSEGVLSANWNFKALHELWEISDTPVRKELPFKQIGAAIANLYARLQNTGANEELADLVEQEPQDEADTQLLTTKDHLLRLDDLPVYSTITRRWPPAKLDYRSVELASPPEMTDFLQEMPPHTALDTGASDQEHMGGSRPPSLAEDETEEMDALPDRDEDL